jgi:hypothetical protein
LPLAEKLKTFSDFPDEHFRNTFVPFSERLFVFGSGIKLITFVKLGYNKSVGSYGAVCKGQFETENQAVLITIWYDQDQSWY